MRERVIVGRGGTGTPNVRMDLRLPRRLAAQLDEIAAANGWSRNTLINKCLTEFVRREQQQNSNN